MDFKTHITTLKPRLKSLIDEILDEKKSQLIGRDDFRVYSRLEDFSTKGKMLRGAFVILSDMMFTKGGYSGPSKSTLYAAAALEVSHAAILIHDDIMDNDRLRRGAKTIFAQYSDEASEKEITSADQYGKSMAMIVADTAFFLTNELFGKMKVDTKTFQSILHNYGFHMQRVCYGQLYDYEYGMTDSGQTEASIKKMYKLKTGSYTFTLPFMIGALLANAPLKEQKILQKITDDLGTAFQIKDDELGLFGDSEKTGKTIGSDIIENKKTLLRARLYGSVNNEEKNLLNSLFGKSAVSQKDINTIKEIVMKYGILEEIHIVIEELSAHAIKNIDKLSITDDHKVLFKEIVEFNNSRSN